MSAEQRCGEGTDTASYRDAPNAVEVNLGLIGEQRTGYGDDSLVNIENLSGSSFDDTLIGDDENNLLDGGEGIDMLIGLGGDDRYGVDGVADVVLEAPDAGIDTVISTVSLRLDDNLENLILLGQADLSGDGNALDNDLTGNAGNNVLDGGDGNDTLFGAGGADSIIGGDGADNLDGGTGTDTMTGGAGDDSYRVDSTTDLVIEKASGGIDTIISSVSLRLGDHVEHLTLAGQANLSGIGNALDNLITGNNGSNLLDGGAGVDTMVGGDGSDSYYVDQLGDVVTETNDDLASGGSDTVYSSLSAYTLTANVENLRLRSTGPSDGRGNALDNTLYAGSGDNVLDGAGGSDTVSYANASAGVTVNLASSQAQDTGGSRTDTLISIENLIGSKYNDRLTGDGLANVLNGGLGNDFLTGGAGADTFRFDTLLKALTNCDTIGDFGSDDTIALENAIFTALKPGSLDGKSFRAGPGFNSAADANDYVIYDSSSGALYYDVDGSGAKAAVQFATLSGAPELSNLDFLVT